MLNSDNIDLLKFGVPDNCRIHIALLGMIGYPAKVTGTVRDQEYQQYCYDNGYSTTNIPSFHSVTAGLAYDICKIGRTQQECYGDETFWQAAGRIGELIGFTWGGRWTRFTDKPHFQWDQNGRYTGSMIRAGLRPSAMPIFKGDLDVLIDEIARKAGVTTAQAVDALAAYIKAANPVEDQWEDSAVQKLRAQGIIKSDHPGNAPVFWGEFAVVANEIANR